MTTADQQQPTGDLEGTIVPLLHSMRDILADIGLAALRIESKLDGLLDALAEEEDGEDDLEPAQTTLDGDVMGAERDEGQPL